MWDPICGPVWDPLWDPVWGTTWDTIWDLYGAGPKWGRSQMWPVPHKSPLWGRPHSLRTLTKSGVRVADRGYYNIIN